MSDLTAERARELLDYDPETGVFRWRVSTSNRVMVGNVAGGISGTGYWFICIDGRKRLAHRLAWLIVHGEWPSLHIDHINGNKLDNRICNLRVATKSQNQANTRKKNNNSSGLKGVGWCAETSRWRAKINIGGKTKCLGRYDCPTAGHIAYCKAAKEHFGEYARTD